MASERRRSASLELDYGDDDLHDQAPPAAAPAPAPVPVPIHGLPANPLTGVRPLAASASPAPPGQPAASPRMSAVYVGDLHWWTSDADIVQLAALAGIDVPFKDVVFAEHKVNGKSKGVVWVECGTLEKAQQLKAYIDHNEYQLKKMTASLTYGGHPSPLRTLPKEPSRALNAPPRPFAGLPPAARPPPSATTAYLHPHPGQNRRDHPNMPGHLGPGGGAGGMGVGMGVGTGMGPGMQGGGGAPMQGAMGPRRPPPPMQQQGGMQQGGMQQGGMGMQQGGMGMQHGGAVNPLFANPGGASGGGGPQNGVYNPAFNGGFDMSAAFGGMGGAFGLPAMGGAFGMGGMGGMGGLMGGMGMGAFDMGAFGGGGGMGAMGMGAMGMPAMGGMGAFGAPPLGNGQPYQDEMDGGAKKRSRTDG
ncbi:hypothetical protein JCM3770_001232 [Rhodotorula araucariae]